MLRTFFILIFSLCLSSCTSIYPIGRIGPKKLEVYAISDNDFLSANRMIVILDTNGNVIAYSGGTVSGAGTVALQTTGTLATVAGVVYSAKAVESGLHNINATIKGIPSTVNVNIRAGLAK